jgi:hypothetical protein
MNTPAERDNAYMAALRSYRSADPISLRLLVDAVEGRARRMRSEAMRELVNGGADAIRRGIAAAGAAIQSVARRQRLPAAAGVKP